MSDLLLTQLVQTLARQPSERERHRARLNLLDWLACIAGARQHEMDDIFRHVMVAEAYVNLRPAYLICAVTERRRTTQPCARRVQRAAQTSHGVCGNVCAH